MDSLPFTQYAQPQLLELAPRSGPAAGGIVAIARGVGFAALASLVAPAGRATAPSCRFGSRVGAAAVLDDTRLACTVPWGYGSQRVLVEVSLASSLGGCITRSSQAASARALTQGRAP